MLIAGNWKMNTNLSSAVELAEGIAEAVGDPGPVQMAVCPPFISLQAVGEKLKSTAVRLGAQNMHAEDEGAFTGEVSAPMLRSVGCDYVILGHSERRQYFGEEDQAVNEKAKKALQQELVPIICVGESQDQRRDGREQEVVRRQVEAALEDVELENGEQLVLAYEPIWAIGTGDTATPQQAQSMHAFIRVVVRDRFGATTAGTMTILYGGSMKPHNAEELLSQPDVDGGLIGGASLKAEDFAAIADTAQALE